MIDPKVTALQQEYQQLLHAVQTAVRTKMELEGKPDTDQTDTGPKHLRVGVNSAIIQASGLALLLIDKGVITELEYWQQQVDTWRAEVTLYEHELSQKMGVEVKLH